MTQESLLLAIIGGCLGYIFGCWSSTPFTRFVLRRNRYLEEQLRESRQALAYWLEHSETVSDTEDEQPWLDNPDWWKER